MDDDWKPHKVNGPNDDDSKKKRRAAIVFLPVPQELKDKGLKAVTYARTFISIDYKGKIFTFTVYKQDITKTHAIYEKALDHEVDPATKSEIWYKCIGANWILHVYTEDEIERDAIGGIGDADALLNLAKENCSQIFKDEYKVPHGAVMINDHLEILPINEGRFKKWLRKTASKEYERDIILRSQLIDEVVNTLAADAEFDGQTKELSLRISSDSTNVLKWQYDLTNDNHEFIEITSDGWKLSKDQIIFRQFDHQRRTINSWIC